MFYAAIYQPSKIKGLRPETKKWVGKKLPLQYGWRETKGSKKGRHYYTAAPFIKSVPESDLKNLTNISRIRHEEIRNKLL